ncbi:hypothetical protein H1C71_018273, partial [Ictidomys tridecemlineatus]
HQSNTEPKQIYRREQKHNNQIELESNGDNMRKQGKKGVQTMQDNLILQEDIETSEAGIGKELKAYLTQMERNIREDMRQQVQAIKVYFENELNKQIQMA